MNNTTQPKVNIMSIPTATRRTSGVSRKSPARPPLGNVKIRNLSDMAYKLGMKGIGATLLSQYFGRFMGY